MAKKHEERRSGEPDDSRKFMKSIFSVPTNGCSGISPQRLSGWDIIVVLAVSKLFSNGPPIQARLGLFAKLYLSHII